MHRLARYGWTLIAAGLISCSILSGSDRSQRPCEHLSGSPLRVVRKMGQIESDRITECSGMDVSKLTSDLLWAINDGGNGPFVYALGIDGRDRGRARVAGIDNRDWEGIDTFVWRGRPMILIADFGDNNRQYDVYTLFAIEEPRLDGERLAASTVVPLAWRIDFVYPDGPHDAEGVAVNSAADEIFILTKRDDPPLLFVLPLAPFSTDRPILAHRSAPIDKIPPPTDEDRRQSYGAVRSRPTALDMSSDGALMAVLTYKHAYLFSRQPGQTWATAVASRPELVRLPLPQYGQDLRQREAICFTQDGNSLMISSEGLNAGIYQVTIR